MIVDLVTFRVKPDRAPEFERHNEDWVSRMRQARGFVTHTLMRNVDRPQEYTAIVRWVNRDYRDRFHGGDDPERSVLQQRARDLLEGPPANVILETL
jgi:heme-degrading monooxygenase HmoA